MTTDSKGQFQPGYIIDKRYRILGFLGAGGFASVYRAMHEGMQREVAIKVMEKCDDESFIERFKREATLAGSIQNPCIVTIYDCGVIEETGQLYTAMELLHGHDLEEELMERGPLSPHRMYTLIRPVLDALGEGHAQGIVHKDLKPANLFLNDPGGDREYLKVLDFGVARKTTDQKLTTTGQMMGTVLYLAPEYINNSQNVSPAIDVYQMALIISELLTGKPCVEGETYSILMKHCMGEIQLADFLREGPAAEVFARATRKALPELHRVWRGTRVDRRLLRQRRPPVRWRGADRLEDERKDVGLRGQKDVHQRDAIPRIRRGRDSRNQAAGSTPDRKDEDVPRGDVCHGHPRVDSRSLRHFHRHRQKHAR